MEQSHRKSSFGRIFVTILVVGLVVLVVMLDARRRQAENQLAEMTIRVEKEGGPQADRLAAQKVVEQVRKIMRIPDDVEPTVATIVDVDQLKQRNAFYAKAKNGDNLIVTPDRAILFDPVANVIVDVVPVSIQAPSSATSSSVGRAQPAR